MRVRVYRNLHKRCYSVLHKLDKVGWRLLTRQYMVILKDVEFIVYESGRQRVLKTKRKNVHAFIEGELLGSEASFTEMKYVLDYNRPAIVKYNPYMGDSFTLLGARQEDDAPIHRAKYAILNNGFAKVIL